MPSSALAPHYAEVVELRKAQRTVADRRARRPLVAGYRHKGDVLLVPRSPLTPRRSTASSAIRCSSGRRPSTRSSG